MRLLAVTMPTTLAASACGVNTGETGGADYGAPACNEFMAVLDQCIAKAPADGKGGLEEFRKLSISGWRMISDKAMLDEACKLSFDTVADSELAAKCPDVKWE